MSTLPNTLLVGAAKAGTTSLCRDLERHPDIYMYPSKETHFFSFRYDKGIDYYQSLFRPNGQPIVMEASPEYSTRGHTQRSADRIAEHIPDARIIYMVRHPLRRLESEYVQELANGLDPLPFSKAIFDWNLIEGSLYQKNYQIFADKFGPENIHVLFFEDYLAEKEAALSDLMAFLNVTDKPDVSAPRKATNTRDEKVIDPPLLKTLRELPLFERAKHLVPDGVKLALKKHISRTVEAETTWDTDVLNAIMPSIRNDAQVFLPRYGKDMGFWF